MNDDDPEPLPGAMGARLLEGILMGLAFYSRLPVPVLTRAPALDAMAPLLALTSLAIGLLPALMMLVLPLAGLPGIFAAGLAIAVLVVLGGAMSEDALADAADGLFGGTTPTRRLEIMRDSRHGTYGVVALVLFLLLRAVAVGAISAAHWLGAGAVWLAAMVLARSLSLWLVVALPPARADGLSASMGGVGRPAFAAGFAVAAVVAAALAVPVVGAGALLAALAVLVLVTLAWTLVCRRLVGGQTGDLIGALQALLELGTLTVFLAFA